MKRYIFILRHGETEYGRKKIYLGHTDCNLSEKGINDARHLSQIFAESGTTINSIFSSDLLRCKETVKVVFPQSEIVFSKDLREINMGDWDGLTFDKIKNKYPEDYKKRGEDIADFTPINGECFRQCQQRAVKVFNNIVNTTEGNIAICSHAGFIKALLCSLLKLDLKDIFSIKQEYGCINIITFEKSEIYVEGVNLKSLYARGEYYDGL